MDINPSTLFSSVINKYDYARAPVIFLKILIPIMIPAIAANTAPAAGNAADTLESTSVCTVVKRPVTMFPSILPPPSIDCRVEPPKGVYRYHIGKSSSPFEVQPLMICRSFLIPKPTSIVENNKTTVN